MKQGRRQLTRWVAMVCGVMLAGVFITWLVVLGLGVSVSLDDFRNSIETAASRVLGAEVHIDGVLVLRPTIGPTIVAHEVRIASPTGQRDLLRAGRVTVRLAPVALLRGKPRSIRLLIEDASVDLDNPDPVAHGTDPAEPGEANAGVYPRLLSASAQLLARQRELQELVLHRIVLNYRDDSTGQPHQVKLDEFTFHTRPGQPLALMLQGRFQQQPYTIDLTGGQLANLLTPNGPWPVRARVSFANTRLLLDGSLEASRQGIAMTFELRVDWPAEFAGLAASSGQAPLSGRLSLVADQPVVTGELQLPALDAVLRFGAEAGPVSHTTDHRVRDGEAPADRPFSVPLTAMIAGVPFHGQLIVAGPGKDPVVELAFSAANANAGRLLAMLIGKPGIRGRFDHIGFRASAHGSGKTGIANRVALALQVEGAKLSYGNAAGERPVDVSVDELALSLPAGEAVMMRVRGSLLDQSFSAEFTADGLKALLVEESWPITLSATGGGAVLDISGPLALAAVHDSTATRLNVSLYGKRIGDLAAWLGVSPCASASYTLRGQLVLAEDVGRLQFLQVQTDRTRLNGELDWSGDDQIALLHAVLHFDELDPADIEALIPTVNQGSDEGAARGVAIDIPVFPTRVQIVNADIDLAIAQILLELVDITEVSLSARIREGGLQRSRFHAHIGNASFQGYLDPTTAETAVVFENEEYGDAPGGRIDKLFSSAVQWVGSTAVVPLRWIFRKRFSAGDSADCQAQGVKTSN